ncbi:hypothetical protein QJS10_CPB04g00883 [Acorus calamus]|uniref:Uncharacterized protein n=1 Tax=Acorus calamus TaxID=4465 RepID=A0AAV9F553_ACOCL|nr:hypothetical protein QJS10_CPB04g00883 [Acorus calamus]
MITGDRKDAKIDLLNDLKAIKSKFSGTRHQLLGLHHQIIQPNSRTSFSEEGENDAARSWTIQSMLRTTIWRILDDLYF